MFKIRIGFALALVFANAPAFSQSQNPGVQVTGSPANNDCAKFVVSGGNVNSITTAGAGCGGTQPTGANPTATAGPNAVNGSATTYMRSDAAPPIQLGSSSQPGLIQCGTGTTCSGGTMSVSGATAANPTATAGPNAVNGSATTYMRSDAAPPIQLGSSSQPGLIQCGTGTTCSGGTMSVTSSTSIDAGGATTTVANGTAGDLLQITGTSPLYLNKIAPTSLTANPSATAGPSAVNGSATTYMRSDAAPAVQVATTSQDGIVEPDGISVCVTGGKISRCMIPQYYNANCGTAGQDCTAALVSCYTSGFACTLPCGTYDTTNSAMGAVAGTLVGSGICSVIRSTSATADGVDIGGSSYGLSGVVVENLAFSASVSKSAGYLLKVQYCTYCHYRNLWSLSSNAYNGFAFPYNQWSTLRDYTVGNCQHIGIDAWDSIITYEGATSLVSACATGYHFGGNSAPIINASAVTNTGSGVLIDTANDATKNCQFFFGEASDLDTNGADGLTISNNSIASGGNCGVIFKGWSASNTVRGITVGSEGGIFMQLVGAELLDNSNGIYSGDAGGTLMVTGGLITGNGYGVTSAAVPAHANISGNVFNNTTSNINGLTGSTTVYCNANSPTSATC